MTDFILKLINNEFWATFVMSFVPMIELKGAIVFARGIGYSFFEALGISFLGSSLIFIPVFFLLIPVLSLLKKIRFVSSFAVKIENYFKTKASDTEKSHKTNNNADNKSTIYKQLGVFVFVAIPLPLTGVWTGTAIAVFLNLKFKQAILPVVLGNLVAGVIISILASICMSIWTIAVLDYILYGLFALAIVLVIITVIKISLSKK